MLQSQLNREIARRGFGPLHIIPVERDPEDLIVDWDQLDLERNVPLFHQLSPLTESNGGVAVCY